VDAEAVEGKSAEDRDPEDFTPAGADLVPASPDPVEVFRVLDAHDERQILTALQGKVLDKTLYDFNDGAGRKVDLSFAGVREVIHHMTYTGKVRIGVMPESLTVEEVVEDGEPYYVATIWAKDEVTGESYPGTSNQPKRMQLKKATAQKWRDKGRQVPDDDKVWDSFARTKAVNKATRNALGMFVPEMIRQTLIAQYLDDPKRIEVIGLSTEADLQELPPPVDDEEMRGKMTEARGLYEQILEAAPGGVKVKLTPAAFHRYATRAETSHQRADGFLELLKQKLAEAKGAES
jgi:hypothetical protein